MRGAARRGRCREERVVACAEVVLLLLRGDEGGLLLLLLLLLGEGVLPLEVRLVREVKVELGRGL